MLIGLTESSFLSISVTPTELSIVSEKKYEDLLKPHFVFDNSNNQRQSWRALRVSGQVYQELYYCMIILIAFVHKVFH